MANVLDFRAMKQHKRYMTTKLDDKENTTLMIGLPPKSVMSELLELYGTVTADVESGDVKKEMIDDMYSMCLKIMNNNKGGIKLTMKKLEEVLVDFDDLILFLTAYIGFVTEVADSKN